MKRSKYTEEQIAFALKQAELGTPVPEVCRKMGVSEATFYNWKKKFGGLCPSELRRLRQLEEECNRAEAPGRRPVAGQGHVAGRVGKKALKPSRRRALVDDLMGRYGVGMTKSCAVVMISRSLYRYESCRRDSTDLVMRIHDIAHTRVHYGYRRVHVMLRREGYRDNHKRVYRLYREQGLSLRHKRPKRNKSAQRRQPKVVAQSINDIWSMDFVMDLVIRWPSAARADLGQQLHAGMSGDRHRTELARRRCGRHPNPSVCDARRAPRDQDR